MVKKEKSVKVKKHIKTSVFKGVCFKRGRWCAQYQKIKFCEFYPTEMEAVAHFLVAFCGCGLNSQKTINRMLIENSLEKGRIPLGEYQQIDDNHVHSFSIDKKHIVKVDEDAYIKYRNYPWFLRLGEVIGISSFNIVNGKCAFEYVSLGELICIDRKRHKSVKGFMPRKINGDNLDLRYANLAKNNEELKAPYLCPSF
jgi:hypothetical protein